MRICEQKWDLLLKIENCSWKATVFKKKKEEERYIKRMIMVHRKRQRNRTEREWEKCDTEYPHTFQKKSKQKRPHMWWQRKAHCLNICENASIYWVYSIIFSIFLFFSSSFALYFLFFFYICCIRSLLAFYLIFFDFAMLTETSNTWATLMMTSLPQHVCSICRIRFIIIYPVSPVLLPLLLVASSQYIRRQIFFSFSVGFFFPRLRFLRVFRLLFAGTLSTFRLFFFFIAIFIRYQMWICAVSFNMWLSVYNGYNVIWCDATYPQCDYIKPIEIFSFHCTQTGAKNAHTHIRITIGIVRAIDNGNVVRTRWRPKKNVLWEEKYKDKDWDWDRDKTIEWKKAKPDQM